MSARFAIYFAPAPDSALWQFGSRLLGYDASTATNIAQHVPEGIEADDWRRWTAEPATYGFHATLKAPFRLADGCAPDAVLEALRREAGRHRPIAPVRLEVAAIGPFIALTPAEPSPELGELADAMVTAFEPFRAPLNATEKARRLAAGLTERQRNNLELYGYPYVGAEFRFHMTLTGALPPDVQAALLPRLAAEYSEAVAPAITIDRLAVFEQPAPGARFSIVADAQLG